MNLGSLLAPLLLSPKLVETVVNLVDGVVRRRNAEQTATILAQLEQIDARLDRLESRVDLLELHFNPRPSRET